MKEERRVVPGGVSVCRQQLNGTRMFDSSVVLETARRGSLALLCYQARVVPGIYLRKDGS